LIRKLKLMRDRATQRAFARFPILVAVALTIAVSIAQAATTPRDAALAALTAAKRVYEKVCEASPQPRATVLPAAVEVRMSRALVVTSDLLAKGDDHELMSALIDYTAVSECSADRDRALALARIFRAKAEPLNGSIAALPPAARCKLVAQLQWGWTNDFLPTPTAPGVSADREARLSKLKQSVAKQCTAG
jgi:hypothetical protein